MNKLFFLQQLIVRLKTEKPAFFAKLQIYAGILITIGGVFEALAYYKVITVSEAVMIAVGGVMAFLAGNFATAQLPTKDTPQK